MKRESQGSLLSTVFVDYDNIYLSLKRKNEDAAKRFAKNAGSWLAEIASGRLITPTNGPSIDVPRRIVMNRCYGNSVPRRNNQDNATDMNSFPFVRHHFVRSGFEVIDCPPLTAQLKNSADIRMVMDVRDYLLHDTYFDEFVILSGDADFTPVLHRLRQHARRTVVYANDYTAAPYRAISDGEVREDDLIRFLTAGETSARVDTQVGQSKGLPSPEMLAESRKDIINEVLGSVQSANRPVPLEALADKAVRTLGHDRTVGLAWGGAGSFRDLLAAGLPENIKMSDAAPYYVYDAARQPEPAPLKAETRPEQHAPTAARTAAMFAEPAPAARNTAPSPSSLAVEPAPLAGLGQTVPRDFQDLAPPSAQPSRAASEPQQQPAPRPAPSQAQRPQPEMFQQAPQTAARVPAPQQEHHEVQRASLPQQAPAQSAPQPSQQRAEPNLDAIHGRQPERVEPAFQAPVQHSPAPAPQAAPENTQGGPDDIQRSIARIHEACQAPPLSPPEYRVLFEVMAEEINKNGLTGAATLVNIAQRAQDVGVEIRRDDARFVLEVVSEADPWFEQGASANLFASRFRNFVVARCRSQGMSLSANELDLIEAWFSSTAQARKPKAEVGGPAPQQQPLQQQSHGGFEPGHSSGQQHPAPQPAQQQAPTGYGAQGQAAGFAQDTFAGQSPVEDDEEFPRIVRSRMR